MSNPLSTFHLYPKQVLAFESSAQFLFYGGAAGGGKSHLERACGIQASAAIPGLQTYLFRRTYQELIDNYMLGPTGFQAMLAEMQDGLLRKHKIKFNETEIKFPNHSRITLVSAQHEQDIWSNQGKEIHFAIISEATQFSEFMIRFIMSRNRIPMSLDIPPHERIRYPRILCGSNPGGMSHQFFKQLFVANHEKFKTPENPYPIWRMAPSDGSRTAQFIPAMVDDNPAINPEQYKASLAGLKRKELVDAMLYGKWDIPLGAFFPELDESIHRIPRFEIPDHWFRYRSFDWGSGAPFACLWIAVSDGIVAGIPKESLIFYREWYGASPFDKTKGLGMSNEQVAEGIRTRTPPNEFIQGTLTDSKPFQAGGGRTIAEDFTLAKVPLQLGDVKPGSRIQGWQQIRSRAIGRDGRPGIFFFEDLEDTWRTLTQLQTDTNPAKKGEDAVTTGEDHLPDAVSLACKARPYVIETPKPEPPRVVVPIYTMNKVLDAHLKAKRKEHADIR